MVKEMNNLIFIHSSPSFRNDHYIDFSVGKLRRDYKVYFFSFSHYQKHIDYSSQDKSKSIHITSDSDLNLNLKEIIGKKFIINTSSAKLYSYFKNVEKRNITFIQISEYAKPLFNMLTAHNISYLSKVKLLLKETLIYKYYYKKRFLDGVSIDYILANKNQNIFLFKRLIHNHTKKYDEFLELSQVKTTNNFILFLDSNVTSHPDFFNYGVGQTGSFLDSAEYLKKLNLFFDIIESKTNLKVVIASHPSSQYDTVDYNGRTVIKNKTPILIHQAAFVVGHQSTSFNNVILEKKPYLFIYYKKMFSSNVARWMEVGLFKAKRVEAMVIDIENKDEIKNIVSIPDINQKLYDKYAEKYLLNPKLKDVSNYSILRNLIDNIN